MGLLDMMCEECPLKDCSSISQERNPSPDILFVGGYPVDFDVQKGPFTGYNSRLLRNIVNDLQRRSLAGGHRLTVDYAYACQCAPPFDVATNKAKIDAEIIAKCSRHLKMRIDSQKPKAILAMGNDALRGLDFKSSVKEMRGGIYHFKTSDGTLIPVVVSFHIVQVAKQPGYLNTFIKDVKKAQLLANDGMQEIPLDIRIPVTPDAIISELDAMISEINQRVLENGMPVVVSCDTETTSLTPANPDDRVIAISLSHKDRFGLAYPFQHRDFQFSEEDFQRIFRKTEELLSSPNVTVDMANAKFDIQWLAFHYKMKMSLPRYDVLLAEHILDEDKKGEYSLKDLTADRFPSMGKYESELKEIRDQKWNEKDEKIRDLQKEHLEKCFAIKLEWWLQLDADARLEKCKPWVSEGLIQMEDLRDLLEVKYRKLKGEMVIPKKYQQAVDKLLVNVPNSKFEEYGLVMPELVIPEELYEKTYEDIPTDVLLRYAAIDALTTRMILASQQADFAQDVNIIKSAERHLGKQIPTRKLHEVMYDNTIPLCHRIARMEYEGVRIDRERCREYSGILQDKIKEAEDAIYTEVGRKFSLSSSSPDLGKILYGEMKLPVLKYTDKKLPSTDADTLKQLNDEHDLPFLEKLLVYRKMDKCRSTYIERWLKDTEKDGYLRAQFNQIGTATFRLSSSNPNLQNIPYNLKEANLNLKALFLPDSDDYELYELDISNAEMRILTAYSKDVALIDAFNHGKDLHCLTAAGISQFEYDDIKEHKEDKTTEQYKARQVAKKVNFGVIYCIGTEGLSRQLWEQLRLRETPEQCQEYMDKFFETYPGVRKYIDDTKNFVQQFGYTWTYTGRRRRFERIKFNPAKGEIERMYRQAVNARIQTTSSDLVMYNLIDTGNWLDTVGGRILLTVHDSILFQLPRNIGPVFADIKNIITGKTAERAPWLPVEWKFDIGKGPNYGATKGEVA